MNNKKEKILQLIAERKKKLKLSREKEQFNDAFKSEDENNKSGYKTEDLENDTTFREKQKEELENEEQKRKSQFLDKMKKRSVGIKGIIGDKSSTQNKIDRDALKKQSTSDAIKKIQKKTSVAGQTHEEKAQYKERRSRLFVVRGQDRGRDAWHYVLLDREKKQAFLEASKSGSLDVADYGKVWCSGWGKDPPEDIQKQVEKWLEEGFE